MPRLFRRWWLAALATLVPIVLLSSWICYQAVRARSAAAVESASAQRIAVSVSALETTTPARGEPISSAAEFRDAAVFRGNLYLCGPDALYAYDADGTPIQTWRSGRELPGVELVSLATGNSRNGLELYIATRGAGVLAFDGKRFRQILPGDERLRNITSVLASNTGRVLLGTANDGILAWDGQNLSRLVPELAHAHVTALAGADSDLWIGTIAAGVRRFHAGQLDNLAAALPDPHVLSIAVRDHETYVGTPVGVVEFQDGRKRRTLADGYFATSLEADDATLAIGTEDEGILTVPLEPNRRLESAMALEAAGPVSRIFRLDGVRYALAGTLYRTGERGASWTQVLEKPKGQLTDRNIAALSIASDGRLWAGYFDHGLDIADGSFENVTHLEDEHLFCVNRIAQEPGGRRTAVATANGLVMFDVNAKIRQVIGRKDGLLADHVTDVLFRPGGMVIATPAGLSFAGPGGIRSLYVFQGLVNNHVYSLAWTGDRVAAGTLGGLSLLQNDAVQVNYTTANSGLKHNWISALARVGDDWFAGTYGAGVMRLDAAGEWHTFPDLKEKFEVNPNAMTLADGTLYVGSLGRGLWMYSLASGRWTNTSAGLPSTNVTAIAAANGLVYVGTDNGLVRFREEELR